MMRDEDVKLGSYQDLTKLRHLSTPAVLECLRCRYKDDVFYTHAGQTLVAVNPFKDVASLYGKRKICEYHAAYHDQGLAPHIYSVAEEAYRNLTYELGKVNQSIIVSGESGAGKTVSAKHLMKYMVTVSNKSSEREEGLGCKIEQRILDSNPILEAFGNAATLRNHNSSRFGKYIDLQFDRCGSICGANINTYLLEKTRVVHQADGEFNFHIFYQMLNGCTDDERLQWGLVDRTIFRIAFHNTTHNKYNCDTEAWNCTRSALEDLGLPYSEHKKIFKVLSAILHLGNVAFCPDEEDEDICCCDQRNSVSVDALRVCCQLLSVEDTKLERALTYRQITASHSRRKSVFHKPCTLTEVNSRKECMAKLLYSRLFDWLVTFINGSFRTNTARNTIGLLDIYGFESFKENSLEQLCINYANEKLQQHFVTYFMRELQDDYTKEAIEWVQTDFIDNRPCLDLLEGNPSIFAIINEECHLNRASDSVSICQRIHTELQDKCSLQTGRGQANVSVFTVNHYAGPVSYCTQSMLHKNKDNVPPELVSLLKQSENSFVAQLFADYEFDSGTKRKKTVLSKFKVSLDSLMLALNQTDAHYIRCIKPNTQNAPNLFSGGYVLAQLEACGVTESVDICKKGYPVRIPYEEFLPRYSLLLTHQPKTALPATPQPLDDNKENELLIDPLDVLYEKQLRLTPRRKSCTPRRKRRRRAGNDTEDNEKGWSSGDHSRKLCASILQVALGVHRLTGSKPMIQFGKTKLFMRDGQLEELELCRSRVQCCHAFTIQCAWRRYKQNKARSILQATILLQAAVRGWLHRKMLVEQHESAQTIQTWYRNIIYTRRARNQLQKACDTSRTPPTELSDNTPDACDSSVTETIVTPTEPINNKQHIEACRAHGSDLNDEKNIKLTLVRTQVTVGDALVLAGLKALAANMVEAVIARSKFQLAGQVGAISYLEAQMGLVSRRRMPRVQIKFHTKRNSLLKCGHYVNRREFQCSITDCLSHYD